MKFLNYILSVYLVVLSCLPCADVHVSSIENKTSEISHNHNEESHEHGKDADLCSPFCSCSCCGSLIMGYFKMASSNFAVVSKNIETQLPSYTSTFISNFFGSIWQPPQLA